MKTVGTGAGIDDKRSAAGTDAGEIAPVVYENERVDAFLAQAAQSPPAYEPNQLIDAPQLGQDPARDGCFHELWLPIANASIRSPS